MISLEFLITTIVVCLIPGTGVLYTVTSTLQAGHSKGFRTGLIASLGCTFGIIPHLLAAGLGFTAIMHAGALAFQILKYAGCAYLFFLAFKMWQEKNIFTFDSSDPNTPQGQNLPALKVISRAVLLNLLNPKLTIFFLAFLPQFINTPVQGFNYQMLLLSLVFMVLTFVVFLLYAVIARQLSYHIQTKPRVMHILQKSFAGIFAFLGLKLLIED